MYDIAIIGLGPAGATIARLLDKKYKVIAIDSKGDNDAKCCGGLLSPDAQKILARFNLCLPSSILVNPQIFSVRTIDLSNNLERYYQRFYLNMDRGKFDRWLISLIPKSTKIIKNAYAKKIEKIDNTYKIEYLENGDKREAKAKVVIGADGANSLVRNTYFKKNKIKKYVAIQEWYENEEQTPIYTSIFDNSLTSSYGWTINKDDYFIIGGAFPKDKCDERFEKMKQKVKDKGFNFSKKVKREGCFVYLSDSNNSVCTGKDNLYLIGEAAGMISCSSLEGISYAMESAYILAKILNKNLLGQNKTYKIKTFKLRTKLKIKILKRPFMYNKFLRKLVMLSKLQAIEKIN